MLNVMMMREHRSELDKDLEPWKSCLCEGDREKGQMHMLVVSSIQLLLALAP